MPLLFNSLSHGEVAFGFFNIETDLLLLENHFIFATDFCTRVSELAACKPVEPCTTTWSMYVLDRAQMGNLMGAIHGFDGRGFIGEIYRLFPFPKEPGAFKQNTDGHRTHALIRSVIEQYQKPRQVSVAVDAGGETLHIGDFLFSRFQFHELLHYVWVGGYPRWMDNVRPTYVLDMVGRMEMSSHPIFADLKPFI